MSQPENKSSEPEAIDKKRLLVTDTSFEEMENDLLYHSINQTPEERLAENKILSDASFEIKNKGQSSTPRRVLEFNQES